MADLKVDELAAKVAALQASLDKVLATPMLPAAYTGGAATGAPASAQVGVETPMEQLDRRIALAPPHEGAQLAMVRQEVARQQEQAADGAHRRRLEALNFYAKVGLAATAFASGVGLVVAGFGLPAFVCLGAALYTIAPEFINKVTDRLPGDKK